MSLHRLVLSVMLLSGFLCLSGRPALAFEPGPSTPSVADLSLHSLPEDEYAESLTLLAYLSDGSRVETGFQVSNLGPGSGHGGFDIELISGGRVAIARESVKHHFVWKSGPRTIDMGDESQLGELAGGGGKKDHPGVRLRTIFASDPASGHGTIGQVGHVVEIVAGAADFGYRLRFVAEVPAWRPGSGTVHFGDRVYQYFVEMPRAKVSGEVRAFGTTRQVTGVGFVEHGRTNVDPRRHTDRQLRLRYFGSADGQPLTVLAYDHLTMPQDGARRFGYLAVFLGDKLVHEGLGPLLEPVGLHPDPQRKQNLIPTGFAVSRDSAVKLHARVTQVVERSDYLDQLSGFMKMIVGHYVHPVSYNYDCSAQVEVNLPALQTSKQGRADCGISLTRP